MKLTGLEHFLPSDPPPRLHASTNIQTIKNSVVLLLFFMIFFPSVFIVWPGVFTLRQRGQVCLC